MTVSGTVGVGGQEYIGISENIEFPGHVSDEELSRFSERATVRGISSLAELQSRANGRAMAMFNPVVAPETLTTPQLVHDGNNGCLLPADEKMGLAD